MLPKSTLNLTFLLFDGFSNMVLASAIEPLRAARDLSGLRLFSWQTASLTGQDVRSSSGLTMAVDLPLDRVGASDALIVLTGYGVRDLMRREVLSAVAHQARGMPMVGGLDTGAWLLAAAGLLTGRRATIHWMERDALAEAFPEVEVLTVAHVTDGNVTTCGGADAVLSWSLSLIGTRADEALRFDVGNMFGQQRDAEAAPAARMDGRMEDRALPAPVLRAVRAMRESAEAPVPLASIADAAALSARTLDRQFRACLGTAAGRYYRLIRLSHARALATETGLTLEEIAARTGFASASTLARAYRLHFGETVRQSRRG